MFLIRINPFRATGLFLKILKKSENQMFSDFFRGYWKKPGARNQLMCGSKAPGDLWVLNVKRSG